MSKADWVHLSRDEVEVLISALGFIEDNIRLTQDEEELLVKLNESLED